MPLYLRSLIGLSPDACSYIESLELGDVAKVLYRDHVRIKHVSRKRLASEMDEKTQHEHSVLKDAAIQSGVLPDAKELEDTVSKMLSKYLLQA